MAVAMDAKALNEFLSAAFPGANQFPYEVVRSDDDGVEVVHHAAGDQLRPGGTVSGPTLMTLADTTAYVAIVARIGPEFMTVTSHMSIDFLRKPSAAGVKGTGEVLKLGKRQAVVLVHMYSVADDSLVATATLTYALPSQSTVGQAPYGPAPGMG